VGQLSIVVLGLVLAGWGQLLVREVGAVVDGWTRMDNLFPPALRSSPTFAGYALLVAGALLALLPLLA
jgi:hypothetical protein